MRRAILPARALGSDMSASCAPSAAVAHVAIRLAGGG